MSWAILWLLVGGTSGWLKDYLEKRYGPLIDSRTRKKNRRRNLLVGLALGPLQTLAIPEMISDAIKDRKALSGPSARDSIQDCLSLRYSIASQIEGIDRQVQKRQALLGGVQHLLEEDFSEEAVRQAGLRPTSEQMPDTRDLRRVCQELRELSLRRAALEEGLALTEERIADWRCEFEGQVEAMEIPEELLRPNASLLRPPNTTRTQPPRPAPAPLPAPDPDQLMLERLGTVSDEVKQRLWGKVDWCISGVADGHGSTHQWSRAVYLSEAYLEKATDKAFRNKRGQIACWISTEVGDRRLGMAISEAETAQEAQALIRWRLKQTEEDS